MANTKVKAEQLEAAQTNITSVGTLTSLAVSGTSTFGGGTTLTNAGVLTLEAGGNLTTASGNDLNIVYPDGRSLFIKEGSTTHLTINNTGAVTFAEEVTFNKDIGLGMNGASFGTGVPTINFKGTSNANTRAGALLFKENNDDDVAALYVTDGSDGYGTVLAAYQGDIKFSTATLAGYKMTIKADGKVGIGTASPVVPLTVYEASNSQMQFQTSGTGTGASDGARFGYNGSGAQIWNFENNYFRVGTNNVERMRITDTGRVGIGTTSPRGVLDVVGDHAVGYILTVQNDGNNVNRYGIKVIAGSDDSSGTSYLLDFFDGDGTNVGAITNAGGTVSYGAFTAHHPCVIPDEDNNEESTEPAYPYGTLLETTSLSYSKNSDGSDTERGIIYNVQKSSGAYSRKVLGAYGGSMNQGPAKETNKHQVLILGDGHILCNNEKGNISVGDGICTSSTAGIGMKADKMAMIIGIAQEDVTFSGSETKLVAVQYGLQQFTPWTD